MAELWTHWAAQGEDYRMSAALVDGEIVGFVGSGPARDEDARARASSTSSTCSTSSTARASASSSSTPPSTATKACTYGSRGQPPCAPVLYARNGFALDGASHVEPFLGEELTEVRFVR